MKMEGKLMVKDIKSYMKRFNVSRTTAIEEMKEFLKDYCKIREESVREMYEGTTISSH